MSLHPQPLGPVPEQTARVAQAAFPQGNLYMRMRDEVGALFSDEQFAPLFSSRGQPAEAPWRLAVVTILQYVEGLSDRQAAAAVRSRIDWKYALGLELSDPGFDFSVLSEFRARLVTGQLEQQLLGALLEWCRQRKGVRARGRERTDLTHVLGAIRGLNRLEGVGEALRRALNSLAVAAPEWLRAHAQPEWVERYEARVEETRWPAGEPEQRAYAEAVGQDGHRLLSRIYTPEAPQWLRQMPAVETLRRVWVQQFYTTDQTVSWRTDVEGVPPAALLSGSPYDTQARNAKKRSTGWMGYRVHLTESCEKEGEPHLITHVETTPAPVVGAESLSAIHADLKDQDLSPRTHLVDAGYVDAQGLVQSQQAYGVDLLGPTRPDNKWQARAGQGFASGSFRIDWDRQQATCPMGQTSVGWFPARDRQRGEVVKIKFSAADCGPCVRRTDCPKSRQRGLTVLSKEPYLALQAARAREATDEYAAEYNQRAFGLRRARYIGLAKTHLQHVITAAAINFVRVAAWLAGRPHAKTRVTPFVALIRQPATG
jgi:transposase